MVSRRPRCLEANRFTAPMVSTAVAFVCIALGAVSAALFLCVPWVLGTGKLVWLFSPWLTVTWLAGTTAALALLGYGAALLSGGAASVHSGLFYLAFLAAFTVTLGAAPRLLLLRRVTHARQVAVHYVLLLTLVAYAALVAAWLPGTLMAALTPPLAVVVQSGVALYGRAHSAALGARHGRQTRVKDTAFWIVLLLTAFGPLADWAMCLGGARDWLWGFLVFVHAANVAIYLKALPPITYSDID